MEANRFLIKISNFWKKISSWSYFLSVIYYRKAWLTDQLKMKKERSKHVTVDNDGIKRIWDGIRIDKGWIQFYNGIQREGDLKSFDARYIPLDIQYCFVDDWFNDTHSALLLDDKNMYDLYFHDVKRPQTIARIVSRHYFDENYASLSIGEVLDRCSECKSVILKPSIGTSGGKGIMFWDVKDGKDTLLKFLSEHNNYLIQAVIRQHPEISRIYPDSINSIRIVTCNYNGSTSVLSAVIRMGVDGNKLDNASQGGLFCGINDDGTLKKYAYSKTGNATTKHPQGAVFSECHIPNYHKCKELVIRLSNRFIRISKLISWDLAIGEDGDPMLIEVNLCYGGADIHQIANGPLFGDLTEEVLDKVFRKSKKYSVINRLIH
jgi:hypothetical protein